MGYFANSTEGDLYEDEYCAHCAHYQETTQCAVLVAHAIYNYEECNNADSILHLLIPRSKDGIGNEKCRMFIPDSDECAGKRATRLSDEDIEGEPPEQRTDRLYREWLAARNATSTQGDDS